LLWLRACLVFGIPKPSNGAKDVSVSDLLTPHLTELHGLLTNYPETTQPTLPSLIQLFTPYLHATLIETILYIQSIIANDDTLSLKCICLWEVLAWRSNQRDGAEGLFYDKAIERALHFAFVKVWEGSI